ncbi:MAG: hypothetical protein R3C12_07585 [Planctomycetaceae bacterium]
MISAKRLSLQLTPLLDLLLIVIFAQYLEIEQKSTAESEAQAAREARQQFELRQSREQLKFTQDVLAATRAFHDNTEQQLAELKNQQQASRDEQQDLLTKLSEVGSQRDRIVSALKQAFAGSSEEIVQLLEQLAHSPGTPQPISPESIQKLADQVAQAPPRDLALLLLAYEEIRKRCDIWELHLDSQGIFTLFDGNTRHSFRASSAEDFQRRLFDLYKSLPQAKSLVILLVSYGEVRADLRQNMLMSMPIVTDRMRNDASGLTRFEYAVIGYLPENDAR